VTDTAAPADARSDEDRRTGEGPTAGGRNGGGPEGASVRSPRSALFVAGLVAVVGGVPLAVALAVLRQPRWYPLLDLAQTELRVRDVDGGHPPLVGLAGRIQGINGEQGSHPGPISFWALWPFYKLFGSGPWALQAASAALNLLAMGVAVGIAQRRGGRVVALAAALGLVVLVRSYGAELMTEAWNPYLPMLWWVVLLLAVWSVLCDDWPMLPVAVFAATFCMQTHIPYSGLVGGMVVFMLIAVAVTAVRRRRDRDRLAGLVRWGLAALGVAVVLWIPPVIDQLTGDPGNLTLIWQTFTDPAEDAVGFTGHAVDIWLAHLDPWTLMTGTSARMAEAEAQSALPGLVLLATWVAAVVVAWRSRWPDLLRLHLVAAVALLLGLISITRILGFVWYYLVLWAWGTTALLVMATAATFVRAWRQRNPSTPVTRYGVALLTAALVAVSVWFTYDAAYTEVPAATESRILRHLAPETVAALRNGTAPGGGEDGRYLLHWADDQLSIGSQGFGLLLALERAGLDVGVPAHHGTGAVDHRVLASDEATAVVQYVVGPHNIERWRRAPEAVEIAYYEPRTAAQVEQYERWHDEVAAGFRAAGSDELAEGLEMNLLATALDRRTPTELATRIQAMMRLGLPAAVFVTPVGVQPPSG
jgi:Dolichyl-phosphate-mannose-protein mannosyltransferase